MRESCVCNIDAACAVQPSWETLVPGHRDQTWGIPGIVQIDPFQWGIMGKKWEHHEFFFCRGSNILNTANSSSFSRYICIAVHGI